jgi:hypothetical protein
MLLMRKVDRAGILDDIDDPVDDLSLMTGLPVEYVEVGMKRLLTLGVIEINNNQLLVPNYLDAQESPRTDAQRQRERRQRRRDMAKSQNKTEQSQNKSGQSQDKTEASHPVTGCHAASQGVTPIPSDPSPVPIPCLTDPMPLKEKCKKKKKPFEYPPDFEAFWIEYPKHRRVEKQITYKEWVSAEKKGLLPDLQTILAALRAQKKSYAWTKDNGEWIVKAKNYVKGACWDDAITPFTGQKQGGPPAKETAIEAHVRRNNELLDRMMDEERDKNGL